MWLWTLIAQSQVTSTWEGPVGICSTKMSENMQRWDSALPNSTQHCPDISKHGRQMIRGDVVTVGTQLLA